MSYSIVFAIPPAVRTLLESAAGLDGVHVTTGPRSIPAGARELAVQEPRASAGRPVTGGTRRESGSFVLRAYWEVPGAGEEAVDKVRGEVDDILSAACDVLEADPTLGGLVRWCDVEEVAEDDQSLQSAGRTYTAHARITFTVDVDPGA